jgi:mRNA interferase MazF
MAWMALSKPQRGEVWLVTLDPVQGHEQAGTRPCVVISDDIFNSGPAGLVVVVPMTSRQWAIPLHVPIVPPVGGVQVPTDILCENVRSVSMRRLLRPLATLPAPAMDEISDRLRILLSL